MHNKKREENLKLIEKLIYKGYKDLGWANEGHGFTHRASERLQPLQMVDCSIIAGQNTNLVYIDNDFREILHVNIEEE